MRIGIDGYNFAMPRGTGVATYGLSLARALEEMGHAVEGVFGLDAGRDRDTRELLFYDRLGRGHLLADRQLKLAVIQRLIASITSERLLDIPQSDQVEKRGFDDRLPRFSRLGSAPLLFETAYARLAYFRSPLTLTMPDPPAIMHWTYPVPIRLKGAKNI